MSAKTITSFAAFWPFYLGEHRMKLTRALHFVGTSVALGMLVMAVWSGNAWLAPVAIVQAFAWAWVAHFFVEKNKPAGFTYPLWSFLADTKMCALMLTGQIDAELKKHHI